MKTLTQTDWIKAKFGDVIGKKGFISDGDWVESKDQDPNGEVRLIQLADIGEGIFLDKSKRFLTLEKAKELRCTFLQPGDLLVARMPDPLGRACIFPVIQIPSVTVVDICIVRPDSNIVDVNWLKHSVNSLLFRSQLKVFISGATRERISRKNLEKIPIAIPPLPEQQRIAAILDKANALREKRWRAIAKLDELLKSVFSEMFGDPVTNPKGWPTLGIEEVCGLVVDCVNRTAPTVENPTPFKMIRTSNVKSGQVNLNNVKYVTEDTFQRWNRRAIPRQGDVLLTREAPVGEAGILEGDELVFLGQRLMLYRTNTEKMTPEYLLFSFLGDFLQQQFAKEGSGSTVKHLPLPVCRNLQIRVPPLKNQQAFSSCVSIIKKLKIKNRSSLQKLDYLFLSLQQRAFSDELSSESEKELEKLIEKLSEESVIEKLLEESSPKQPEQLSLFSLLE